MSARDQAKEKAKDDRLNKQSTHQAELIQQTDEMMDQMMG